MKILDTAITEIVKGNSARYYSKYIVDKKEYTNTLNKFNFQNITNPNNEITIGNTCASSVTFSIYMPQVSLENKEITIYEGVKVSNEIKYIKLGTFTVSKQTSNGEYTSYEAYDKMYKADMPYSSDLVFPSTDKAILTEICGKLGISLATDIVTAHTVSDKPQGYTMREIIGYMAMLQGCNAVINADGNLELRWYKDSGYVLDGHKYYQQGVTFTTSKDFIIQKLTCNNTKSGDKETSTITSGSGATGLSFANPFMTQAVLDEVYKKIGGFQFRPLTVKFVGDWRLEVGDIITVNKGGVDYKVPIMQITHECDGGLMSTVTSIGQSDTENSNIASGPITKQMERYYANLLVVNKALINKLDVDTAKITYATIANLNATNANIDALKTNKLDAAYADIINANVESLKAANAEITQLKANSLTVDIADLKYAQIDFANVKGQVVGTSLIKDGAVTNEKVQSLSANKLTAGVIDAAKITVNNLNADNITAGTINGKRIGTGSLSLDKLSEEVPTKEYLDKVQEELQGQIDGNIETFTKTEIPTLNNEPAINWKDNATKNKHIGDICYVVNPASSADGYSYRFANTGTEQAPVYEWVLIKDSDVTKALQDIININGEITGIKKFNVEISSWKTDTDSELSSLKTRTTSLETDMGNKVDTTTFNKVKQTVDENSSTITKMSETLSKKADSGTVTTLSNTVNSIKQTTDSNTSSISSLTTTVTKVENTANSASKTASEAKTAASKAETAASNSATSAANAKKSADTANTNASAAVSTANTAKSTADSAKSTATAANNTANTAKSTADSALSKVNTLTTTVTNQGSSITQLQGSITNKVWKTDITESINNLQVGGTNMLLWTTTMPGKFSSDSSGASSKGTVSYQSDGSAFVVNNNSNFRFQYHPDVNVMIGATYVVSAYYRDVSGTQAHQFQIVYATASGKYADFHGVTGTRKVGDGWKQSYLVFTIPDTIKTPNLITVYLRSGADYTLYNHSYYIKNVKLELGNKVTTWSPAPEDVSSGINAVDTKVTTVSNQYTTLNQTVNSISATVNSHTSQIATKADNSTITTINNKVTSLTSDLSGFKTTVSNTYATKNSLSNYATTTAMNSAISQSANSITQSVSATYATKSSLSSYATTASLSAYIAKTDTGTLKSCIEAIADTINITARGGLNLSGNRFTLNSTNTSITADGTITCKNFVGNGGTIGGWNINSTSIYSDYRYDPSVGYGLYRVSLDKSTGSDSKVMSVRATVKDNVFNYPFYVRSDGYLYTVKGQISGFQFDSNKMSNTVSVYLLPDKDVLHTLRNAIVNNTTSQLALSQYDLNGSGKVDLTDFVVAKNYVLGTQTETNFSKWKYAKKSDITYKLNPSDVKNALSISGTDIWGKTRRTTLGIGTLYSNEISCDNLIVKDPVDYSTFNTFLNTINVKETSTSIDLENFVRNYTIKGNGMLVVNISIWTDTKDDYGTTTAKIYIDGNCVMNNRNRLANSHPSELAGGATFVWWFNDNATHRIKLEAGSTKEGTKTYTQSIQALFGLQIST
jgi:trimeric autotransporter adhesin